MDANFLEFWAKVFKTAAQNQRLLEETSKWLGQGFKGSEELFRIFRQVYTLPEPVPEKPENKALYQQAMDSFGQGMKQYSALIGMVPKEEHLALKKKYEKLKEEVAEKEETIKHLRMLMQNNDFVQDNLYQGLCSLMNKQAEQYFELINKITLAQPPSTQSPDKRQE